MRLNAQITGVKGLKSVFVKISLVEAHKIDLKPEARRDLKPGYYLSCGRKVIRTLGMVVIGI